MEEIVRVVSSLNDAGCLIILLVMVVYMSRWLGPLFIRMMDSHDRHIDRILSILEGIDNRQDLD